MTEPTYKYVKGKGWVLETNPDSRVWVSKGITWVIKRVEEAPAKARTWRNSKKYALDLLTCSDEELNEYADRHWYAYGDPPGLVSNESRRVDRNQVMYLFTEVE